MSYPNQSTDNDQPTLFSQPAPHSGSATSRAAAEAIEPTRSQLRERVYECSKSAGASGLTDVECQVLLNMQGDAQRPRRRELVQQGKVVCVGSETRTPSKRSAMVWVVADVVNGSEDAAR